MTNFLLKTREIYNDLNKTEQKIASYILLHTQDILNYPIAELARRSGVSQAAWVRFCKTMGFLGLKDLKKVMISELNSQSMTTNEKHAKSPAEGNDIKSVSEHVLFNHLKSIEDTMKVIDLQNVEAAARAIKNAKQIGVFGVGDASLVALDACFKFIASGKHCFASPDIKMQVVGASSLGEDDVAIIISYSGMTKEMLDVLKYAKQQKAKVISITKYGKNQISHEADINLFISAPEVNKYGGSMGSRIAQLTVIDLLCSFYFRNTEGSSNMLVHRMASYSPMRKYR